MSLNKRDKKTIWHPYTPAKLSPDSIGIIKSKGTLLWDENGNKYIDAVSSWWTNIHGHAHPFIANAIAQQAKKLEQVIFAGFTHKPAVHLAERLLKLLPSNQSKVFFSDDGSTAVEVALKMSLQYFFNSGKKKQIVIAIENSYHGDTFGAMSVSGRGVFTNPFNELLFQVRFIPFPSMGEGEKVALESLKNIILSEKENISAFIFEPLVQGTAGMMMYESGVLDKLIRICKENDIITIADEVMTGFGRTGEMFACNELKEKPDIFCLSKGLTGGFMPLGITTCSGAIFESFYSDDRLKTFFHGHSYTANPLACSAANASLDLFDTENTLKKISAINKQHNNWKETMVGNKMIKEIRVKGSICAVEIKSNDTSYFFSLRDKLYQFYLSKGVLLRPLGNVVYILPPYCITKKELSKVYSVIEESILKIVK